LSYIIDPVRLVVKDFLPEKEFHKLLSWCMEVQGKRMLTENGEHTYYLHPSHKAGATKLLKKLGIIPFYKEEQIGKIVEVEAGERVKMPLTIVLRTDGLFVTQTKTGQADFVPNLNISILWKMLKEENSMFPRKIWAKLTVAHNLFPELEKAVQIVRASPVSEIEKDEIITFLESYRASIFEGLRVKRVKRSDKPTVTYYSGYWYPLLWLKDQGLVEQVYKGEVFLTDRGLELNDWQEVSKPIKVIT
jgi:hypothetical protein